MIRLAALTDMGRLRKRNEDAFGYTGGGVVQATREAVVREIEESPFLAVVADGVGGRPRGELASRLVVEEVLGAGPSNRPELVEAVRSADRALRDHRGAAEGTEGPSSTIVAVLIDEATISVAWAGDSRAYLVEPNGRVVRLTEDHAPTGGSVLPGVPSPGLLRALAVVSWLAE